MAATHGSPWAYDTHVPLVLAGPGIPPERIVRRAETVDDAPTIAAYLGTGLVSGARGMAAGRGTGQNGAGPGMS